MFMYFFNQKTAYDRRISDWSSDLCSSDLVSTGWASETRDLLNRHATNQFDPTCTRCSYQPYCGRAVVDDLARYGRIDLPRHQTEFCRSHLHLFDFLFSLITNDEPAVDRKSVV